MDNLETLYMSLKSAPYFEYYGLKKQYEMRNMSREEQRAVFQRENERMRPYMNPYDNLFMKIPHFEESMFFQCGKTDQIVIQEKIDGSNAHLNVSSQGFTCCGNRFILNEQNHLQGFWHWCSQHYRQVPEEYFGLDIYGEWLVPHHCIYPAERYGEFYVFDVMENGRYWTQDRVRELAERCGFHSVPLFYSGEFQTWDHVLAYVGRTQLGGEKGEGIVLKNQSKLNKSGHPFYMKLVDREYQETNRSRQEVKAADPEKLKGIAHKWELSEGIVTLPRVRKAVFRLVEQHELPENWQALADAEVLRIVRRAVYRDCLEEEKEITEQIGKMFGKYCGDFTQIALQKLKEE